MFIVIHISTLNDTHRHHDSSKADHKRSESGWGPNSWKSLPLLQNSWNNHSHSTSLWLPTPIKTDNPIPWISYLQRYLLTLWREYLPWINLFHFTMAPVLVLSRVKSKTHTWQPSQGLITRTWDVTVPLLLARNLAFSAHRSLIKNTEPEFGGNRRWFILSWWRRGNTVGSWLQELFRPPPWGV